MLVPDYLCILFYTTLRPYDDVATVLSYLSAVVLVTGLLDKDIF